MANERITENIVRELFRDNKYYEIDNNITIEEQKSEIQRVKKLLSKSSKKGTGKGGYPEFIVTSSLDTDFIIVVECKANIKDHESKDYPNNADAVKYAVDGVLHYAKHLSKEYTVLAIAVSGTKEDSLKISNYLIPCGSDNIKVLTNESGTEVKEILSFDDYYRLSAFDPEVERKRHQDLISFARGLHEFIWTKAKISEEDKPLLVSGTLIALMSKAFSNSFNSYSAEEMPDEWLRAIKKELDKADIPQAKKDTMLQPYANVATQPNLGKPDSKLMKQYPQGVLFEIIKEINENVWPFISVYHNFDVVGHFYGEFLKYTAGDKKALGIVLTPRHITELFCEIANITKKDTVLDICTGTGGFLISAMKSMLQTANTEEERKDIKKNRLIGVENNPKMFTLAASNMILRGDGKANLHQGSCFDNAITENITSKEPNIGLLNPPYAQSKSDAELHELYFTKHMLDQLQEGGIGIVIIPLSCVISPSQAKHDILENHTLKAVMSMPDDLFYPVGTVTCIVVFEAKKPHKETNRKTWFGYWKKDGFEKTKHLGRIDLNNKWNSIKEHWIETYKNNEVHDGESITKYITADDEWIAEAYLKADYSTLKRDDFKKTVLNYIALSIKEGNLISAFDTMDNLVSLKKETSMIDSPELMTMNWKSFLLEEVFDITKGERLTKNNQISGTTPLITAGEDNNGITSRIDFDSFKDTKKYYKDTLTVDMFFNTFYHDYTYFSDDNIHTLSIKEEYKDSLNKYIYLFLATVLSINKFKYSYGRQVRLSRLKDETISLPIDSNGTPDWDFMEEYIKTIPYSTTAS